MTYGRPSRIAGNVLTPSRSLLPVLSSSRIPVPAMNYLQKKLLWTPSIGIRFSPKLEPRSLYPNLDLSRFLHTTDGGSQNDGVLEAPLGRLEIDSPDQPEVLGIPLDQPPVTAPPTAEIDPVTQSDGTEAEQKKREPQTVTPPWTPLDYKISPDLFHAARASRVGSPNSFWSYTMYHSIAEDGSEQGVKVHYCETRHNMEDICQKHFSDVDVIGFDLEWHSGASGSDPPRKNVSLIQIATPSRIGLFHVARFKDEDKDIIGPKFREIMENVNVTKVGVAISADCTRLRKFFGVTVRGVFELSHLYKLVKHSNDGDLRSINRKLVTLSAQAEDVLRLPLYKGANVRTSDWTRTLNEQQLKYSAADAYAGLQLFYVLEERRKQLDPCPPRPHHAELGLPIRVAEKVPDDLSDDSLNDSDLDDAMDDVLVVLEAQVSPPTPKPRAQNPPPPKPQRDARIVAAELKMTKYRSSKKTGIFAGPSALRAYYLWHGNNDLDPESIAKLLRDPPLQTNTVVTYILDSVKSERLPYNKVRMTAVLSLLHPNVASGPKYQSLFKECQLLNT